MRSQIRIQRMDWQNRDAVKKSPCRKENTAMADVAPKSCSKPQYGISRTQIGQGETYNSAGSIERRDGSFVLAVGPNESTEINQLTSRYITAKRKTSARLSLTPTLLFPIRAHLEHFHYSYQLQIETATEKPSPLL